jgi:rSAM/selenodomain-associated transferase 1
MRDRCILFFVKAPEPGRVKTRLARLMGDEQAARLYRMFVLDMLDELDKVEARLVVCHDPGNDPDLFRQWLGSRREYMAQEGFDLGERMENAMVAAYDRGCSRVLVVGSDLPDLTARVIEQAFQVQETHDAVLGPATDGGYYLIGMERGSFQPRVFRGVSWSMPDVFSTTLRLFQEVGSRVALLPRWRDVDCPSDLESLVRRHRLTDFARSRTCREINESGILGET